MGAREHSRGSVERIEGRQVRAVCSCSWTTRVYIDYVKEDQFDQALAEAEDRAEHLLLLHQRRYDGTTHDTGIQLNKDEGDTL